RPLRRSAKLGADTPRTANSAGSATHTPAGGHSAGKRSRPASGRRLDTVGKPLRWRTSTGTRAGFLETAAAPPPNTSNCGLLKQPYKQKLTSLAFGRIQANPKDSESAADRLRFPGESPSNILRWHTLAKNRGAPAGADWWRDA